MLRWFPTRRRRWKLTVLLSGLFFMRMLLGQLSSFVELDFDSSKRGVYESFHGDFDYHDFEHHRPVDPDQWLRYRPPVQSGLSDKVGKRFNVSASRLSWKIKDLESVTVTRETVDQFVVVTAASAAFYQYSLEAIATVQHHLPNRTIFFYDLDGKRNRKNKVTQQIAETCDVRYRDFDFARYPRHVQYLKNYAWKPLIIAELLTEYPGVLWIDSSIRFVTSNFSVIFQKAVESKGMLALTSTGHSNYAVTHPQMYSFLLTSEEGMIKTDQHEANCVLIYRTRPALEYVVWWWMLCALDPLCIAPTNRTNCDNPYKSRSVLANCHRFDQSALNILLANYFVFDYMRYFGSSLVAQVNRNGGSSDFADKRRVCSSATSPNSSRTVFLKHRTS